MNKFMIILGATTALTLAAPAAAQSGRGNIQLRVDQLRTELQMGVRSGAISRSEAMPLREQLRELIQLERRFAVGGINGRERAHLQHRINTLRQQIRMAARDRGYGYDRNDDRYDRDGRYDRDDDYDRDDRYERNGDDRWDRDDDDRDGRWDRDDDDRHDRDDDYRDGNGGLLDRVIDTVDGRGALRVGQRVTADLGPVPSAYRSQFRDGNGTYFRSDGRQIYQVDVRTQTVVRVYSMNR